MYPTTTACGKLTFKAPSIAFLFVAALLISTAHLFGFTGPPCRPPIAFCAVTVKSSACQANPAVLLDLSLALIQSASSVTPSTQNVKSSFIVTVNFANGCSCNAYFTAINVAFARHKLSAPSGNRG